MMYHDSSCKANVKTSYFILMYHNLHYVMENVRDSVQTLWRVDSVEALADTDKCDHQLPNHVPSITEL